MIEEIEFDNRRHQQHQFANGLQAALNYVTDDLEKQETLISAFNKYFSFIYQEAFKDGRDANEVDFQKFMKEIITEEGGSVTFFIQDGKTAYRSIKPKGDCDG